MVYGSWHVLHDGCNYFSFQAIFCPFIPDSPKKFKKKKKRKKNPRDIVILRMCTKNYDQMVYSSWDMVCDRCNCYLSFWAIFCPFTPLKAQKIKILKKWRKKNAWRYHHFTYVTTNYDQMMYSSWDMVHDRCKCYFSFWAIFCPFTSLAAQKIIN